MTPATRARLQEVVDSLFVNGSGEVADRLVLTQDGPPTRNLGGWSRAALMHQLAACLAAEGELEQFGSRESAEYPNKAARRAGPPVSALQAPAPFDPIQHAAEGEEEPQ